MLVSLDFRNPEFVIVCHAETGWHRSCKCSTISPSRGPWSIAWLEYAHVVFRRNGPLQPMLWKGPSPGRSIEEDVEERRRGELLELRHGVAVLRGMLTLKEASTRGFEDSGKLPSKRWASCASESTSTVVRWTSLAASFPGDVLLVR